MQITGLLTVVLVALFSLSDVNYVAAEREPECPTKQLESGGYPCIRISEPVCGTDDTTYSNECELCNAKLKKQDLKVKTDWQCAKDECEGATPDQGCPMNLAPVCGSDNFSYSNACMFCSKWAMNPELYIMARVACEEITQA
ncbi:serine protease inhibitor Kazal-type 4-like [Hyperolius riggenbachi]|uniref:serine protease inhibitor Kazal-type 4-like n=1 Tax=Hyperolius riggenbachi TaxID=752182 RepID=UPI0035A35904